MTAHAKFLFDTEFGESAMDDEPPAPTFSMEELEAVRTAAFAQGAEEGRKQATAEFMSGASARIDKLITQAAALARDVQMQRDALAAEAVEVAVVSAEMLAQTLIAREPNEMILALFEDCIAHVSEAPHIVVRIGSGELEHLRDELISRAELHGCNGRIVVLSEDDMQPGDCRIEWADGGVNRDGAHLRQTLRRLIESRFPPGWQPKLPEHEDNPDGQEQLPLDEHAGAAMKEPDNE